MACMMLCGPCGINFLLPESSWSVLPPVHDKRKDFRWYFNTRRHRHQQLSYSLLLSHGCKNRLGLYSGYCILRFLDVSLAFTFTSCASFRTFVMHMSVPSTPSLCRLWYSTASQVSISQIHLSFTFSYRTLSYILSIFNSPCIP